MFILQIVTFGIYRLYWFAKTRNELMARTQVKIPSVLFLLLPIGIVMLALGFFVASSFPGYSSLGASNKCMERQGFSTTSSSQSYSYQESVSRTQAQKQCDSENSVKTSAASSVIASLLIFVAFTLYLPLLAWWVWKYCEAVEQVTEEKVSRILGMVLFLVVPDGIDILIVQDYYNKVPPAQGVPVS